MNAVESARLRHRERLAWALIWVAFAVFCGLLLGVPLGARWVIQNFTTERRASLMPIRGTALVQDPGLGRELNATSGMELREGDQLRTPADAQALVSLSDGSNIRLWPNTRVSIVRSRQTRFNSRHGETVVRLVEGHARFEVALPSTEAREFVVELGPTEVAGAASAHAAVRLREGSYSIFVSKEQSEVIVREGSATVVLGSQAVEVLRNERLAVVPVGALGQPQRAARNLLVNGSFGEDFVGWQQGSRDVEDGIGGTITTHVEDGRTLARLARRGSVKHGETFLHQQLNRDVTDEQSLRLSLEFKIVQQSLSGGGWLGTEYPLVVRLKYRDSNGTEVPWQRTFYIQNTAGNPAHGTQVRPGIWSRLQIDLFDPSQVSPRPSELLWIEIAASGWEYETYVTNAELIAE